MTNLFQETLLQKKLREKEALNEPLTGGFTGDILREGEDASPVLSQVVPEEKEFGTMEVLKAAFATENTVGSAIAAMGASNFGEEEEDPDYDIFDKIENTAYEPYLDSFKDVFNDSQFNRIATKIDNERKNREILEASGGEGLAASLFAGILDPVNLIPIGGSAYKSFKVGKIAQGIAKGAQAGGLSTIASESLLQNTQELRTFEESAFNVAGSAILGGVIGGSAAGLSGKQFKGLAKRVEDDIQRQESQINIDNDGNLSAAKVPRTTLDQETLAGGKITNAVIKSTKKLNPMLRVLEGPSLEARRLVPELVRTNMYFKKNAEEIATSQSVEIAIKGYDKGLGFGTQNNNQLAKTAVKRLRKEGVKMSKENFNDQVSLAMIRGDKSEIPEVQAAAASWRREVFNPLKDQAIEQGLLSKDVKPETAVSYMMRQYNIRKMVAQEPEFKEIIRVGARERLIPQITESLQKTESRISAAEEKISDITGKESARDFLLDVGKEESRIVKSIGRVNASLRDLRKQKAASTDPELTAKINKLIDIDSVELKRIKDEQASLLEGVKEIESETGLTLTEIKKINLGEGRAPTSKERVSVSEEITKIQKSLDKDPLNNKLLGRLDDLLERRIELDILVGDDLAINAYVDEIADSVFDNIRGIERKGVAMPYDIEVGVRGPAKERVLTFVTDEEVRGFLETDINRLAQNYTRTMAADVELKRSFGDLNLKPQLKAINDEFTELRKGKTEKERAKLDKDEKETVEIINAFKDMIRGDYGRPNNPDSFWPRAARISRMIQYMSKLGGVAISSIPDAGRHVMIHGFNRVFGTGVKGLITNTKGFKMSIADAKQAGQLMEAVTHQRSALMADVADPYANGTQFERTLTWMSDNFSKLSLLDYWNNYQKGFSSVITQQRMIENLSNFDNLKSKESRYMAFLGIDKNNVNGIKKQLKAHSSKEGSFNIANLDKWTDAEAARIYKNAMNTDVDRTIVTKGVGDVPLLMNTEMGKTIGQFKSFAFAAHQQVLISGMQQGDAAAVSGIATMVAMGMMTYYFKTTAAGRELSEDIKVWIAEGIDRSGIMPVIMEINGVADVFGFGAGQLTGQKPLSRFATRNKVGGLIGPSFGGITDVATATGAAVSATVGDGEFKESDMRALRRNLPYQNIFYLRGLLNEAEKSLQK